jgi:hypothetical protein
VLACQIVEAQAGIGVGHAAEAVTQCDVQASIPNPHELPGVCA